MADEYVVSMRFSVKDGLSQPARQMDQSLRNLTNSQRSASKETDLLTQAQNKLVQVFAVAKIKQFAEEFYDLGAQVNAADELFRHFGGNDKAMENLRVQTHGLATDLELMTGSANFMNLGITRTMDETSKLIGMIAAVKKPTDDLNSSLDNFASLMANQSYLRLDSFGLSSARVKERVDELKNSLNMGTEAAFTQAVMEALSDKATALGNAAYSGETALGRLQVKLSNIAAGAAEQFANVIDRAFTSLEQLIAIAESGNLGALFGKGVYSAYDFAVTGAALRLRDEYQAQREAMRADIAQQVTQAQAAVQQFVATHNDASQPGVTEEMNRLVEAARAAEEWRVQYDNLWSSEPDTEVLQRTAMMIVDVQSAWRGASKSVMEYLASTNAAGKAAADAAAQAASQAQTNQLLAQDKYMMNDMYAFMTQLATRNDDPNFQTSQMYSLLDMGQYLEPARAESMQQAAAGIARMAKEAKDYFGDMISDAEIKAMQDLADKAQELADKGEAAARAFESLTLGGLLGEGSTFTQRQMGEFGDMIMSAAQGNGVTGDSLKQLQDAWNLATGKATNMSLELEKIAGDIARLPVQDQITAGENLVMSLQQLQLNGVDVSQIPAGQLEYFAGLQGGGGQEVIIKAGDTLYDVAERFGGAVDDWRVLLDKNGYLQPGAYQVGNVSGLVPNFDAETVVQQYLDMIRRGTSEYADLGTGTLFSNTWANNMWSGIPNNPLLGNTVFGNIPSDASGSIFSTGGMNSQQIAGDIESMSQNAPLVETAFNGISDAADDVAVNTLAIKDYLKEISSGDYKVKVNLDVTYPAILDKLFGDEAGKISDVTRANGGRVPGSDSRSRQIER